MQRTHQSGFLTKATALMTRGTCMQPTAQPEGLIEISRGLRSLRRYPRTARPHEPHPGGVPHPPLITSRSNQIFWVVFNSVLLEQPFQFVNEAHVLVVLLLPGDVFFNIGIHEVARATLGE